MNKLPVELIEKILREACLDDKLTASSLALTSKNIRQVAEAVRYEAVSLRGLPQIKGFITVLGSFHRNSKPAVEHLFLSGLGATTEKELKMQKNKELKTRAIICRLALPNRLKVETSQPTIAQKTVPSASGTGNERDLWANIQKIVQITAPHLRTLFIDSINETFPLSFGCALPNLVDLSILPSSRYSQLDTSETFPKLKRIHTELNLGGSEETKRVDFRKITPVLEQLRSSNVGTRERGLLGMLKGEGGGKDSVIFPETMQRLIPRQSPFPYGAKCGTGKRSYRNFGRALLQAAAIHSSRGEAAGYQLALLPANTLEMWLEGKITTLGYCYEDARRDWIDVISGEGKGCWDDSNAEPIDPRLAVDYFD